MGESTTIGSFNHGAARAAFPGSRSVWSHDRASLTSLTMGSHPAIGSLDDRAAGVSTGTLTMRDGRAVGAMPHIGAAKPT